MKDPGKIIREDAKDQQREHQEADARQTPVFLHQRMGHIVNHSQEQEHPGKNNQEQDQAEFRRMIGFGLRQVEKRLSFPVFHRKGCGAG